MVFGLDDLPLLVPQRVGGLQVVLLRQSGVDEDSWELDYAAVGRFTGGLEFAAKDEAGTEYVPTGGWTSGDAGLLVGAQTFAPRLEEGVASLELFLSFDESVSGTTQDRRHQSASAVAAHWAERLQSQRAAWSRRDAVVEAVLGAPTRSEALRRLSAPPVGFSETQASHIIDMSLALFTEQGEDELQELLAAAQSHLQDDSIA